MTGCGRLHPFVRLALAPAWQPSLGAGPGTVPVVIAQFALARPPGDRTLRPYRSGAAPRLVWT